MITIQSKKRLILKEVKNNKILILKIYIGVFLSKTENKENI